MATTDKIEGGRKKVQRAYNLLRPRIEQMAVGVPLPTVPQLTRELKVSQLTIHRAYGMLEADGLIDRYLGKGVFVADPLATGEFAIVLNADLLSSEASPFHRVTTSELTRLLKSYNDNWAIKIHTGVMIEGDNQRFSRSLDLVSPKGKKGIRGVFSFHPLLDLETELFEAGIPVITFSDSVSKYTLWFDYEDLIEKSITHLEEVGCRSVGMIWQTYNKPMSPNHERPFKSAIKDRLDCRDQWILKHIGDMYERHGYEMFMQFWNQPERPDGLIVTDDILCKGVLRAIMELGLSLPDDVRLVTMANKQTELPWQQPVTRVNFDCSLLAKAGVEMMISLLKKDGPQEANVLFQGQLQRGATT